MQQSASVIRVSAAALLGLTVTFLAQAEGRKQLWSLDLSRIVAHQGDPSSHVWGVRFSPDETMLAIGFGPDWSSDRRQNVVIVSISHPSVVLYRFQLNTYSRLASADNIVWSPSGSALEVRGYRTTLRIDSKAPCTFPEDWEFGGFLDGDRSVVINRGLNQKSAEIRIYQSDCSVSDNWAVTPTPVNVLDTSPERDLIAIRRTLGSPLSPKGAVIELIAASTHEVTKRWELQNPAAVASFDGGFRFVDNSSLVCTGYLPAGKYSDGVHAVCWDVQSGAVAGKNDKVNLYLGSINSTGGGLLAITDYRVSSHEGTFWRFMDMDGVGFRMRRRLIWDPRTGKEISSWGRFSPNDILQKSLLGTDATHLRTIEEPFVVSLSPTGKYIAEGGAGSLWLYSVER
jgi:hypothetical protein